MRFFIDTGSVAEVEEIAAWGVLSGATTNPSLLAKEKGEPEDIIRRICDLVNGPVSAEVVATEPEGMIAEGRALKALHEHVTVKVPFSPAGLAACRALSDEGIPVNMTLVFSPNQALLAAEAGATFISCFMGRLDDISIDSAEIVKGIVDCLRPAGVTLAGARRLDPPSRARHHRGQARLRGGDGPGEGAPPDARAPAHVERHREVQRRLGEPAGVRRVAARAGRGSAVKS